MSSFFAGVSDAHREANRGANREANEAAAMCRFERGVVYGKGTEEHRSGVQSEQACCALCAGEPGCAVATYVPASNSCWFHGQDALSRRLNASKGAVSCLVNEPWSVSVSVCLHICAVHTCVQRSPRTRLFHAYFCNICTANYLLAGMYNYIITTGCRE